jgi:hypothetical protein
MGEFFKRVALGRLIYVNVKDDFFNGEGLFGTRGLAYIDDLYGRSKFWKVLPPLQY